MSVVDKRSELVFLYDIKDANPNGDPLDANKPRIDEETGINLVTDVRLKRTIRDYFFEYKGYNGEDNKDIFVREIGADDGTIQDGKMRAKDFKEDPEKVLESCIDVRLFGGVIPLSGDSITYTGPVQFQMGRSLHPVELKYIKGTGAFASGSGKSKKTFREEYVVPYSLIGFYGIVNENAAKETNLSEDDVELLIEGMWKGTKNLITRSKMGQTPRLLLKVNYSEENFFIGELKEYINLATDKREEEIRDVSDYKLDITALVDILEINKDKVDSIDYLVNPRIKFINDGDDVELEDLDKFTKIKL
ncbi:MULTISPECIES: type I-B CRISPR-associated protein Cas7/Csh2 [unclassified Candidatus Frackibacter]|uniref:type I-B CRISPR-associated protein Cas7/Csh2 n=1 Tax=unclassified Candidatus Frackibacter TaxID=2648818 RepID=UPI000891F8C6|nr:MULTISPECIES: type I-B CRISPR-associated protein Cas7/Csh2 [unclassified Candidatus Frackibacter]SDC86059.1 CRISPR-associated protein, Csh2 family [Candidatus Frackibacter sp. WG11]SEN00372.1 CRISPR-associated protein, Csh2 family [Candidatus Frackibacter sp. WG12]SFL55831.1 CRISPR-associated protein, Csh2 family [Candidatus Frackibacter sp. WG13]